MTNIQELMLYIKNLHSDTSCINLQLVLDKAIQVGVLKNRTGLAYNYVILDIVNNHFDADCSKKSRVRKHIRARETACYMLRTYTQLTLAEVGILCGDIDHTTVIHHIKKVNHYSKYDMEYRDEINNLHTLIKTEYESKQNNSI